MQSMPDIAALVKIAQSPAGQKILSMLQTNHSADLDRITTAAASGNLEEAKEKLSVILSSKEVQDLLKQLEKNL